MKCDFDLKKKCKYPPTCQRVCDTIVQARQNMFRTSSEQLRSQILEHNSLRDCLSVVNSLCRERSGSSWKFRIQPADFKKQIPLFASSPTQPVRPSLLRVHSHAPSKMQAPVIVMNDASARQTGRKAQTSNITAAKVSLPYIYSPDCRSCPMSFEPVLGQRRC